MSGREYRSWADCHDPDAERHSVPVYPWRQAPAHLRTRRQLRASGLQPGRQPVAALLMRPRRRRPQDPLVAYLYDIHRARPKRPPTPAQLAAVHAALRARRTCASCRQDAGYCIPHVLPLAGDCLDCAAAAGRIELGDPTKAA